jgi:hypothetical protein
MAGRYAVAMSERTVTELRAYLKKVKRDPIPEFDAFLKEVETFGKLRFEAEDGFLRNRHRAKSKRHALPLDWVDIARILSPDVESPEVSLVTEVVKLCLSEVEAIIQDLRKVLIRHREKVSLEVVQQVDAQCLRWLSKQPGRDAVEKAGSRQRILAVVRRENYNTLENRVLKDFIIRIQFPCAEYLKRNEPRFKESDIVKQVRRLYNLCGEALHNPLIEDVSDLKELPHPNYVLRQEWRYSKVWKAYCRIIRHAGIAERLWLRRLELSDTLKDLRGAVPLQMSARAKYHCPIWFNYVDGKNELLDKPFYENEEGKVNTTDNMSTVATGSDVIIDLTGAQPYCDLLIYGRHENAKPYLQNYKKPSIEDLRGEHHYFLRDILKARDKEKLRDYFEQLHSLVGGDRWYILVPDEWEPLWQEAVIKSTPLPRNRVFLLWRSVAAVISCIDKLKAASEGEMITVIDIQQSGLVGMSKLTLACEENGGKLIPQRKSYVRHKRCYSQVLLESSGRVSKRNAFLTGEVPKYTLYSTDLIKLKDFSRDSKHVVFVDNVNLLPDNIPSGWVVSSGALLEHGTRRFISLRNKGKIAYYDELEALSLIVQTRDEQIEGRTLVEANEKSPGGLELPPQSLPQAATLKKHSDYVDLVLCMGDLTPDAPIKIKRHVFSKSLEEDHVIDLVSRVTPGQGMALVTVMSDFLREPILLDFLEGMTDKGKGGRALTIATLEDEMERSFPPDSPDVVADYGLWANIREDVERYMNDEIPPNKTWFARASWLYPNNSELPKGSTPLERLRRKNVFGNDPGHRLPEMDQESTLWEIQNSSFYFDDLFSKLATDYESGAYNQDEIARLIAWTYQTDYPAFKRIRKNIVKKVLDYAKGKSEDAPLLQEMTLCANLCTSSSEWSDCLNAIMCRLKNYDNNVSRDFYLLYNLLQFHPSILRDAQSKITDLRLDESCWLLVQHFPYWYEQYRYRRTTIPYILKSLLYFLRCRRFDDKVFLTRENDPDHYRIISAMLKNQVYESHEDLRRLVIEYLNGKGTIDGLPMD